jgi:hypothetical protein
MNANNFQLVENPMKQILKSIQHKYSPGSMVPDAQTYSVRLRWAVPSGGFLIPQGIYIWSEHTTGF